MKSIINNIQNYFSTNKKKYFFFSYVYYWRVKFREEPLTTFCTSFLSDCTPDGKPSKNEPYFLLSDCISEDKTLREELQREKLVCNFCFLKYKIKKLINIYLN